MIGNNSAGARSIVYGKTNDHVRRLRAILADGSQAEFTPLTTAEWDRKAEAATAEGAAYREVRQVVGRAADEIRRRFPRILRRVSGYNLLDVVPAPADGAPARTPGLLPVLIGSEGTLAVTAEADVNLVPRPNARGLLVPHFSSLAAALEAVATCLELRPSAVELMDSELIRLAAGNLALRERMAAIQGVPAALLMVEFSGAGTAEVSYQVHELQRRLQRMPGLTASVPALEAGLRDSLWDLRRAGMPLLYGLPGDRKPTTFVEDAAVPPERLPEFTARFSEILHKHGTEGAYYGHASVGCLHIRPLLNLKDTADVAAMRRITEEVTDLVLEFNGCLSGEHGDGYARSEWNRKMYGPAVYEAFREVKRAFDPHNLLNPGKVVDAPAMTENLRYGPGYDPREPSTLFDYSKQEGFVRSIELCNGSGVCRKLKGGTMCPSFRATLDEKDSTRARANALRLALADGQGLSGPSAQWVYDVLDLCLMCKACKSECPSNVDLAKLKAEVLNLRYQDRARPILHRMLSRLHRVNRWSSLAAPLANLVQRNRLVRWMMHHFAGIDQRRSLPTMHFNHFRRWFARHRVSWNAALNPRLGTVLLLDDCFTTYNEPAIGQAAVRVLEAAGYNIELAGLTCCGRTMLSKGYLPEARALIQEQAPRLAAKIAAGMPILGLEPSCLLTLVDEWPDLVPGPATSLIAKSAHLADGW